MNIFTLLSYTDYISSPYRIELYTRTIASRFVPSISYHDRFVPVVYGYSSISIWGGAMGSYRKSRQWRDRKRTEVCYAHVQPEVAQYPPSGAFSPEEALCGTGSMICTCATGSCAIFTLVGPFDRKWCYETLPRSDRRGVEGVCMRNTCPSGPFSPELALSLVICPFPAILFAWGAPSIEGYTAFIQACDWLYIEAALTFFFF